jgi:UDP-N-acetylmuramoyl-tripeptide--D-alanyl-D-alanine ligase
VSGRLRVGDIVRWAKATLVAGDPDTACRGVGIDSRRVAPGSLFVAIRGPRHDAHAFLADAAKAGAAALLVARGVALPPDLPEAVAVVAADDTTRALADVAGGHRRRFSIPLVAITGSNGKTTTKEMCAAILSARAPCLRTEGNLNNQYGLPLTLLSLEERHRAAVVEIGMNHAGEIAPLAALAAPTVGLVTNVGTAHIENLGSQDAIAAEKGALFEALGADGVAVANADDPRVMAQLGRTRARRLTYGRGRDADVRAEREAPASAAGVAFEIATPAGRAAVRVAGVGTVLASNALAAAAASLAAGASLDDVVSGLAAYRAPAGRLEPIALPDGVTILDDSYNANPQSMEVALRSLATLKGRHRGLAVLGDMGELGDTAPAAHRATGRLAAELGLDFVFALGERAGEVLAGAREAGLDPERTFASRDADELAARLGAVVRGGDWVLVKGSRAMRMERVVRALAAAAMPEGAEAGR